MRVALLIPPRDYAAEWKWAFEPQADALRAAGASVDGLPWDDAGDLTGYDLVLPLVAWGYHKDYARWLALLDRWESECVSLANPLPVLRWNGDKSYLAELGAKGIATVPSLAFDKFDERSLEHARNVFAGSELVVKPTVSASAHGTFRLGSSDAFPESVRGWRMLVQPWLRDIVVSGEWSLLLFDGKFSHSVSKVPRTGEFRVQPEFGGTIERCEPPHGAIELAQMALAAAPAPTVYARVDLVVGNDGALQVIELELIEPALFLAQAPDAGARFAAAVLSAAKGALE